MRISLLILGCFTLIFLNNVAAQDTFNIIPKPAYIEVEKGFYTFKENPLIFIDSPKCLQDVLIFSRQVKKLFDRGTSINDSDWSRSDIVIQYDSVQRYEGYSVRRQAESYNIIITEQQIKIRAYGSGVLYALETLLQMMRKNGRGQLIVPCCSINDSPVFKWRGMHLDVSRHFFSKDSIKRYLDAMALYKMNVFHWHLTDDQGWRLEIKNYPKLTSVGAYRKETIVGKHFNPFVGDGIEHGGYYTQEDVKEIVRYATDRHITIVPEIEMPGHCQAALAAYREYSTTGGPFEVMTTWGESADVFKPGKETFTFLENILKEVMAIFPGKYIHIGGDEVSKTQWHNSPYCQQLMNENGLKNEDELQSYFIRHIDSFITAHGRSTIGWDEILEGGIAPNAAIMSWRGIEGGKAAARLHHNVVMCPGGNCYFDHYQGNPKLEPLAIGGYATVEKVYNYDPIPDSLSADQQKYILGAQGNVWTEYIPTFDHVQYMALPRMCALSEVLWTYKTNRSYDDFKKRLVHHFDLLKVLGFKYATSIFDMKTEIKPEKNEDGLELSLTPGVSGYGIYYTTDNSHLSNHSILYTSPITIKSNTEIKAACFNNGKITGHIWQQKFTVNKATGKELALDIPPSASYNAGGAFTLVDGINGSMPWYGKEWLGWSGKDCMATIDLGKSQEIYSFNVGLLEDRNSWIYASQHIEVWISDDNRSYRKISNNTLTDITEGINRPYLRFTLVKTTRARYVKLKIYNYGKIPEGNPGAGHDTWLFVDEIGIE